MLLENSMVAGILLGVALGWLGPTATDSPPRVSATDTAYLSCTVWTGKGWSRPTARSARTPVLDSPNGVRAYGEVKVVVKNGSCENTTMLYVASAAGQEFKVAYKAPSGDGNGIRLIGWSPDGKKLLADVNFWKYETDRGFGEVPLIYDTATGQATEIPEAGKALAAHFGSDCEFDTSTWGWKSNSQILIRVSRTPTDESYEQHFCVEQPRLFVFDLLKGTVRPTGSK
jgi:hypothetical protein